MEARKTGGGRWMGASLRSRTAPRWEVVDAAAVVGRDRRLRCRGPIGGFGASMAVGRHARLSLRSRRDGLVGCGAVECILSLRRGRCRGSCWCWEEIF